MNTPCLEYQRRETQKPVSELPRLDSRFSICKLGSLITLLVWTTLIGSGCTTRQAYEPKASVEQAIFIRAQSQYSPHDVRKDPDLYLRTIVAWVGRVENIQFNLGTGPAAARILLQHQKADFDRYSSSADDFVIQEAPPSGYFQIAWPISGYQDYEKLKKLSPGSTLIAYGYPTEHLNGVVGINPLVYVRAMGEDSL